MSCKTTVSIFLAVFLMSPYGAAERFELHRSVDPRLTGDGVRKIRGDHVAIDSSLGLGLLLITVGGTNSKPNEFVNVHRWAHELGYVVIGVDYPNTVITTTCQAAPDLSCYDEFRKEIVTGKNVSPLVDVNSANSILNRVTSLLRYLARLKPNQSWSRFLTKSGDVVWSRVVLVGHSQGSGHAAYIAKLYQLARVILIAGPQDRSQLGFAPWLSLPSATEPARFFSFFHQDDFFGAEGQANAVRILMNNQTEPVYMIENSISLPLTGHIYMTNVKTQDPHNSLTLPNFAAAWQALLSTQAITEITEPVTSANDALP